MLRPQLIISTDLNPNSGLPENQRGWKASVKRRAWVLKPGNIVAPQRQPKLRIQRFPRWATVLQTRSALCGELVSSPLRPAGRTVATPAAGLDWPAGCAQVRPSVPRGSADTAAAVIFPAASTASATAALPRGRDGAAVALACSRRSWRNRQAAPRSRRAEPSRRSGAAAGARDRSRSTKTKRCRTSSRSCGSQ